LEPTAHELVVAETIALTNEDTSSFSQSITPDVQTDFSFFVSHEQGVFYISLESWIRKLETELAEPQSQGLEFRLTRILESATTQADLVLPRPSTPGTTETEHQEVTSCVVVADGNLGYFVLTSVANQPQAVILDAPEDGLPTEQELAEYMEVELPSRQARPTYQPPRVLYDPLQFLSDMDRFVPARHKASSTDEMRLSPANLDILMTAHKALSQDTHKLQSAVSDLFIRCERLRDEFRDQVFRVAQLVGKIDGVTGNDETAHGSDSDAYGNAKIEERLHRVKAKQEAINSRYEAIRKKMAHVGGTELSEKEQAFVEELQAMNRSMDRTAQTLSDDPDGSNEPAWHRIAEVKKMKDDIAKQVERAATAETEERAAAGAGVKVPSHSRKQEQEAIDALLQRETALVEAATSRLRSMGISIPLENGS
jgi:nucleoporin NUP82